MKRLFVAVTLILFFPAFLLAREDKTVDVIESVSKSIVNIKTEEWSKGAGEGKSRDILKRMFSEDEEGESEAVENIGSGVVLDPRGIIVTNEHLVAKAITIRVKFTNRQEFDATVLAADAELDIALLKIQSDRTDFPFLRIGRKKPVRVGERAIVIGNPYGLSSTVTTGVISALGRNLRINNRVYVNLIQTDAAINPGSSGGALLDAEGDLLGIITAIYEEGKGIGFAISIEDVASMLSEFSDAGAKRGILGVFFERKKDEKGSHLYVTEVIRGSPAELHGIRVGDRIVELNKKRIREGMKIHTALIHGRDGGAPSQIKIMRGSEALTVYVNSSDITGYVPLPLDERLLRLRLSDIQGYMKLKFRVREKNGVIVTKVYKGGIGERYALRPGDVILKVNNHDVEDMNQFRTLVAEALRTNYILFQVNRNNEVFFVPMKLDSLL
jgi:serine protease Do